MATTATAKDLRLTVYTRGGWHRYAAVFTGPNADAMAVAFIEARSKTCSFGVDEEFDHEVFPLTDACLNPTCEHGLSERLCAGPGHYPMDM
jgi:hypothetical protein